MQRSSFALLFAATACTPQYGMTSLQDPVDIQTEGTEGTTPTEPGTTPDPGEPAPEDDCDHTSDLIYVIDRSDQGLYLFDPATAGFHFLFELDCTIWGTPGSMAVARDGVAYVRYSDNEVYAVNLQSGSCSTTTYGAGFGAFGMGFATDDANTWHDALYIANSDQLAELDTGTWGLSDLGGMPSQSELTGNADGELWAFLPLENPAALVEIDKVSGGTMQQMSLPSFVDAADLDAFAFANWGGDFYLFVRTFGMGNTTDVYKVSATGDLTPMSMDTGMDIVGAGVSTCAPTE